MKTLVKNAISGLCIAASFLLISSTLQAQVLARSGEVAGTVGYDYTNYYPPDGPTSTHFCGGSGGYNATPYISILGEYKYDPLSISGSPVTYYSQLFGGAARFNFSPSKKIVPYTIVGVGDYRFTASESGESVSFNGYYVNFGGGASVYCGKHWGIRPEVRYERQQGTFMGGSIHANVADVSGSIFYQWGGTGKKKK